MEITTNYSTDTLSDEMFSPLNGTPWLFTEDVCEPKQARGACIVAVDRVGTLPAFDPQHVDVLITTRLDAPAPWVGVPAERLDAQIAQARSTIAQAPIAATMLSRLLRIGENLPFEFALELESLAYSTLLGGGEFARWLTHRQVLEETDAATAVRYEREDDLVTLTLAAPAIRNAMTAAMRDALYEALANVLDDPSRPQLILRGEGRCFSTGGHLPEFGSTQDLAAAHLIRTQRSCTRLLHRLGDRGKVCLHGACVGSGIEIPAAAGRRVGTASMFAQLPELRMGLIPGAGGTVSVARAIGRHRLMWLALGAFRLGAVQALEWGLLHEVIS